VADASDLKLAQVMAARRGWVLSAVMRDLEDGVADGQPVNSRILLFEMETGEVRELVASGNQPRYVPASTICSCLSKIMGRIRESSTGEKPWLAAKVTGSSQNLQDARSRST
jgi:hypothetical protein